MTVVWDSDGSIHSRTERCLAAEVYTCSFCGRAPIGGPMVGIEGADSKPVYTCEVHFLAVRSAQDFGRRRRAKENRRWNKK